LQQFGGERTSSKRAGFPEDGKKMKWVKKTDRGVPSATSKGGDEKEGKYGEKGRGEAAEANKNLSTAQKRGRREKGNPEMKMSAVSRVLETRKNGERDHAEGGDPTLGRRGRRGASGKGRG